jgi:hypothetical protein
LRFPRGQAGVQDPFTSSLCVDFVDDEQECAGSSRSSFRLLDRHLLAIGTKDRAIALTDPEFKAARSRSFDGPKPTFKVS